MCYASRRDEKRVMSRFSQVDAASLQSPGALSAVGCASGLVLVVWCYVADGRIAVTSIRMREVGLRKTRASWGTQKLKCGMVRSGSQHLCCGGKPEIAASARPIFSRERHCPEEPRADRSQIHAPGRGGCRQNVAHSCAGGGGCSLYRLFCLSFLSDCFENSTSILTTVVQTVQSHVPDEQR